MRNWIKVNLITRTLARKSRDSHLIYDETSIAIDLPFVELFEWVCAVSSTHHYGRVSDLLSGRQTTHAAQRTAKSTLTYELGTGEVPSSLLSFYSYTYIPTSRRRKSKRTVYSLRSWLSATFSLSFTTGSRVIRPLFHRTSHPWPSSFFSITSLSCVSFRPLLASTTTVTDEK